MHLKKHYDPADLKKFDPEKPKTRPPARRIEIKRGQKIWKPSTRLIEQALADGWIRFENGTITLKTIDSQDDVSYKVLAPPGIYCCHCGDKLPGQIAARAHVAAEHGGEPSPNGKHPAGYVRHNFYLTERIDG